MTRSAENPKSHEFPAAKRQELFESPERRAEVEEKLAKIGVSLITNPPPTGEELHRLEGWRDNREES